MEKSRKKNAVRNFSSGIVVQFANKILAFIVQTVFIKMLSTEYLGINGLFSNILTVLSFAELGFGTAIIYNMYKPVAEDDKEKIKSLMQLYKKVYNTIGFIVIICGLCIIPFLKYIISDLPDIKENINLIYLLFLINTASSYFITYKKSIISAYQQESIINVYSSICYIVKSTLEIIVLILAKNYLLYLFIEIGCTIIQNIAVSLKAEKMFPYLKEKNVNPISAEEKKGIFANVKALAMYKFAGTILTGTDNIIISSIFGVGIVGICSNYNLIINSVKSIINSALNSIVASIGNLNVSEANEKREKIFCQIFFISYIIYGFCAIAILVLINPFIEIWIGKKYLLEYITVFALGISLYVEGVKFASYTYRTTLGLFVKGRFMPILAALLNIVLSIVLGKKIGLCGVFFATAISRLITNSWFDPYLIYRYSFKTSVKKFYKKYVIYILTFIMETFFCLWLTNLIPGYGILEFILRCIIVIIVPNLINVLLFYNTNEFQALKNKFIIPFLRKFNKKFSNI